MTLLTFDFIMATAQRVARSLVIKFFNLPGFLAVALGTFAALEFGAEIILMKVLMAG